jgi:hypothetical protein
MAFQGLAAVMHRSSKERQKYRLAFGAGVARCMMLGCSWTAGQQQHFLGKLWQLPLLLVMLPARLLLLLLGL